MKISEFVRLFIFIFPIIWQTAYAGFAQTEPELVLRSKIYAPNISSQLALFSADGKRSAQVTGFSGDILITDTATGLVTNTLKASLDPLSQAMAFSRDGRMLAVGGSHFSGVQLFDADTGQLLRIFRLRGLFEVSGTGGLAFSPDDRFLITGGSFLRMWEVGSGRLLRQFDGHKDAVSAVAVSPDGKVLASAGDDNTIRFWSLTDGKEIKQVAATTSPVKQIAFSRNGQILYGYNLNREVISWNTANGKETGKFNSAAYHVRFDPGGETLTAVDEAFKTNVWNLTTRKIVKSSELQTQSVQGVETNYADISFSPPNSPAPFLTVSGSEYLLRFPLETGGKVSVSDENLGYRRKIANSPDGKIIATGGYGRIDLRDIQTGRPTGSLQDSFKTVESLAYSRDGRMLAAGTDSGVVLWDTETNTVRQILKGLDKAAKSISISQDGRRLMAFDDKKTIVWETADGTEKLSVNNSIYDAAALSPDGRLLAVNGESISGLQDRTTVWDVENGVPVRDLMQTRVSGAGSGKANSALAFSPDGRLLAAANLEGFIELWNAETGERIGNLAGQRGEIGDLQFDAEGRLLASVADDEIALWNVAERRKIAGLYSVGEKDWAIIAPDGRFEATPAAQKLLYWIRDGKPVGFETFANKFETPGLFGKLLAEKSFLPVRFKNDVRPAPAVRLETTAKGRNAGDEIEIKAEVTERGGGFGELQLRHNGKLTAVEHPSAFKKEPDGRFTKTYRLKLAPGTNDFRAAAFSTEEIAGDWARVKIEAEHEISKTERELVLPRGQGGKILALKTSADGRILASLAEDRTAKLWNTQTGKEIRGLTADKGFFASFALSSDGRFLATGTAVEDFKLQSPAEVTVWDMKSGLALKTFDEYGDNSFPAVTDLSFSPDGRILAGIVGSAQIFDDGVSKTGSRLVVREAESGRQIRILEAEKDFRAAIFSPDGKTLLVPDGNLIKFFDLSSGKMFKKSEGHTDLILDCVLSPDGKIIASAGKDDTVRLWDFETGGLKQTLPVPAKDFRGFNFSADGQMLLTAGSNGVIRFWNVRDGELSATHNSGEKTVYDVSLALGGQFFASAHDDGIIKLWDTDSKKVRRVLRRQSEAVKHLLISPENGQIVASTGKGSTVWELDRLRLADSNDAGFFSPEFTQKFGYLGENLFVTPDLKTVVVPDFQNKQILVANSETKEQKKLLALPLGPGENSWLTKVAVSDDGKSVAAVGEAGIKVWNTTDASEKALTDGSFYLSSLALNSDGSLAALGSQFGLVAVWEITANKFRILREANLEYESEPVSSLAFSPDGKLLAGVMADARIKIWELASGKEKFTLAGNKDGTHTLVFLPSGKALLSGGADGQIKLWNLETGKETVSLFAVGERDFVAVTPDGFYTASKNAAREISVRIGGELTPFEQFDIKFNRPDIVLERAGLVEAEIVRIFREAVEKRLRRLGFSPETAAQVVPAEPPGLIFLNEPPAKTRERTLTVKVKAADQTSSLKKIEVTVNGVPAADEYVFGERTKSAEKELKIELSRGINKIKIVAVNERGAGSLPFEFETVLETDFVKPDLYVLVIGVNNYADSRYNLNYAAKDADDLARFFESKRPRFGKVEIHRLLDREATKERIQREHEFLLRAGVEDEVVVFISGHGIIDRDLNYYFGTHDIDFRNPSEKGLRYEDLENLLDKLRARKKLLLIDTCHAGEVDKESVKAAPVQNTDDKALAEDKKAVVKRDVEIVKLDGESGLGLRNSFELLGELFADLRGSSGTQVIAAASGVEVAYERGELKNGVFTFALLEALNSEDTDRNEDGKIQVFELRDYVNRRVAELTDGVQTPVMRAENIEFDFSVF